MADKLCLKWNKHSDAFEKILSKHYLQDAYSDSTILCGGNYYPVHRLVLSTCSEYFENLFDQYIRMNKHPFIVVKDIESKHIEALLNYMYKGEVNVPQDDLPELIKSAEAFKVRGLAMPETDKQKEIITVDGYQALSESQSPPPLPPVDVDFGLHSPVNVPDCNTSQDDLVSIMIIHVYSI